MKTKVFLKTALLSAVILFGSISTFAANKNNLIYNSEEKDGVMVGQTVYKMDGSTLANYMKYSYKYDDQQRMTESETMKWNSIKNAWENELRVCYTYQGKSLTTTYYKWNSKQKAYILVPEMTVTMDNPNL
ncbi:DUF3836 domain-containing protein [uncultured Bacteroides sp.]|jgi:hypothetical protein|uniref:DUF3836 domain-containing protein n=1 Tax=uncultured Bacteroides sp. TaxID=162156 RepID=UPI0023D12EE3|nr:DUF3836 domain-containing protein [uncultured Bacteroides sp.]MDE5702747.1 DUF3836 domain-containing protein [Bacteroides sp.]MDE6171978.1 DUF3836 domain-containing protein [Bacteroides sp.]